MNKAPQNKRRDTAIILTAEYIFSLKTREPPYIYSKKDDYTVWSASKIAAQTILQRILDGEDPYMVVEDYAIKMDYFSEKASKSGKYDACVTFTTGSDVAIQLMHLFQQNDIHCEEDI